MRFTKRIISDCKKTGVYIKSNSKLIEIVAGPNGSGKTTFAESYLLRTKNTAVFLNPDLIAAGIAPLEFERASFQAGRVLIAEVKNRIGRRESFSFESTLSGKSWVPILRSAIDQGYNITVYFLFLNNIQKNLKRIEKRVRLGGHSVPKKIVLRRYPRCFANFWNLYRPLCHSWFIFDNSNPAPKLFMRKSTFDQCSPGEQQKFVLRFLKGTGQK